MAQLPLVAGGFVALQRGWVHIGSTVERERTYWRERWQQEHDERVASDDRLELFRGTMKDNLDVLERSVDLTERLLNRGG